MMDNRKLAQDALRWVSREYADEVKHYAKMQKRHGDRWSRAAGVATLIWLSYGNTHCMAVLQSMIEDRL